ncbi:MAG: type 2 lantipeptide synthetase LanM, partial [Gemmataceae bacterium]|nr:type 2 lantipeptide synthetase LanM [Gemmataceae bacterium]
MVQLSFASAAWYKALTLRERLPAPLASPNGIPSNAERARHRLDQWRAQPPFATDGYFPQRLTADGLGEDDLLHLLGESAFSLRQRLATPPPWLAALARAFATADPGPLPPAAPSPSPQPLAGFLAALQPLLQPAHARLCRGVESLVRACPHAPFERDAVVPLLWSGVPERLLGRAARTLVLELHVARLQGRLHGDSSQARFQNFLGGFCQPEQLLALLQEYPVLARELSRTLERAVAFELELLHHLCADADALRTHFNPDGDLGMLTEVQGDGDTHRGGRAVRIVTFSSGLRLVYKPRCMAVEVQFQALLAWLNQRGAQPPLRTLKVLDSGRHGWSEWAAAGACHTAAEVQRFYERLGGLLAVLYGLAAADMHHENLIAAGEHPVLVDLEALFHPDVHTWDLRHADNGAARALWESVMGTLLLPFRVSVAANGAGMDLSGLTQAEGQQTPYPVPQWRDEGTEAMRLERSHKALAGAKNCPTLNGAAVDPLDYQEALLAGFTSTYDLLARQRDALQAPTGPLAGFAHAEVRVILRSTKTYGVLLRESFHPDVLHDALDRERLWDRLWATVPGNPRLAQAIPFERADLEQGDIPLFTTFPASRHLWSSGGERLPDFLAESGLERAQSCLRRLGPADRSRQLWFLRASLATLADS